MARCGCTGSCSCVVQGVAPITVTGNGSIQQPYVITLAFGGQTGCAAITACISQNLGPGLVYDEGTGDIQVRLSTDDGQVLRFGTDEGLLGTNGTGPTPDICVTGISSLPAAPDVVMAHDLGGLRGPYSSPYSLEQSIAVGNDIHHFHVGTSADDVGVVTDYWDKWFSEGRSSIYSSQDCRRLSSATIKSFFNYAGNVDDPLSYNPGDDVTDRTDRRGGWWGMLAPRYYQQLAGDFLQRVRGHGVALMDCTVSPVSPTTEAVDIVGAIRATLEYCAQQWVMIGVAQVTNAQTVINAGMTPIMMPTRPSTWGSTALPYTVAELTGAGIEWLYLSDRCADSVFTTYRDAGINVIMMTNSRHHQRARVEALGIRGGSAYDTVYYRGHQVGDWPYGYRTESDPWEQRRPGIGQLSFATDQQAVLSRAGNVRGRFDENEEGLILPAGFGDGIGRPSVLAGWRCPMPNTTSYTLSYDAKITVLATVSPNRARFGLLFAALTDQDTYDWPSSSALNPVGYPAGQETMYRVFQRQSGEIGIAKWMPGTGSYTVLATANTPAVSTNIWNNYQVTVSPAQITFTRTLESGPVYTITAADTDYRGAYVFVEKEEGAVTDSANPFEAKFRNLFYNQV